MKTLVLDARVLREEGRWDIDYHLPALEIARFPAEIVHVVRDVADVVKAKRDPTKKPNDSFLYVDIASVDVETGTIERPQELTGEEAPSRARKVIQAYDILISSCRPTRGAIAIVPEELHGQICSTGFSVIRAKPTINPFYLHFVLRLASTLEQLRKWSTGSSYPAILDEDVLKTRVPVLGPKEQDEVALHVRAAIASRQAAIADANRAWEDSIAGMSSWIRGEAKLTGIQNTQGMVCSCAEIAERLAALGSIKEEEEPSEEEQEELELQG